MVSEVRRDLIILAMASLLFLFSSQILSFVGSTFSSPDETANAFFSEIFATQSRLFSFESLNTVLGDVLYPRSTISISGRIEPISFVGLPLLFGGLIKIFGAWSLTFWTPLFAILAVFAWYAIWRKIFDRRFGLYSALLLLTMPAWWYWASRPMMHNVLAVSFLIFSVLFLIVRPIFGRFKNNWWLDYVLAGLILGGSLWVRTSEFFWLAPLAIFILLMIWKKKSWKFLIVFLVTLVVSIIPFLFLNQSLYGNYFSFGYTTVSSTIVQSVQDVQVVQNVQPSTIIDRLPFGFHPRTALRNVWNYGLLMFWWLTISAIIGVIILWKRRQVRPRQAAALLGVAAILGVVYGSSAIHDNPDLSAVTIGNSYSRYWLPLFVAITPLVAAALIWFGDLKISKKIISTICFLVFVVFSVNIVFFSSPDALWPMRQRLVEAATIHDQVLVLTEPNAVIVVDRADKLFFPDRRVRYPLRDEITYSLLPKIITVAPLYYYGITFPQIDLDYLNNEKLKGLGLKIELVEIFGVEALYKIECLTICLNPD